MGTLDIGGIAYDCPLAHGDDPGHCSWCGRELVGRQTRWCSPLCPDVFTRNHYWTDARRFVLRRDRRTCQRCGDVPNVPEVNHKTPILGRHGEGGCHHHVSGLETLCHRCHVAETNRQRTAGELTQPL